MTERRNKNRGYQQLVVWQDAIALYQTICEVFRDFPFELKRVASQELSSADSIHRIIAEGYCRRSINAYIAHLYIALGSMGETVSGLHACHRANQLPDESFDRLDALAYKIENGMLRLVESLETKRDQGDWIDSLVVKESNETYSI